MYCKIRIIVIIVGLQVARVRRFFSVSLLGLWNWCLSSVLFGFQAALSLTVGLAAFTPAVLCHQTLASWAFRGVCESKCMWVHVCEGEKGRTRKGVIKKVSGRGVGEIQQPAVLLHTLHPGPTSGPMCHQSVICSVPTVSCIFSALISSFFSFKASVFSVSYTVYLLSVPHIYTWICLYVQGLPRTYRR